ncbi:Palmitoyltransferase [Hondaea fermentalgiana]|uniref:Palmitoyltransferase n=1 Tax=Hondaea fermentalgiana TaxID=2315210 RepID=A0A2R5GQX8_9STRA|nr:Palmitoyltransferase [Hondaea fermentalgiana]|eukprot:GBG33260.1 Palmitoyltransferase [Hondaea fermentalgiana]
MPAMVRKNGLHPPFTVPVLLAWVGQATSFFICGAVLYLLSETWATVIAVLLMVSVTGLWFYVQGVDPAQPGGFPLPCFRTSQAKARYCAVCKKVVPGLDHHCPWLGHCVGTRNYLQFYLLSVMGWVCAAWQCVIGLYLVLDETSREQGIARAQGSKTTFAAILGVHFLCSVIILSSYISLWAFHTYLLYIGKGTYMYMIDQSNARRGLGQATKAAKPSATAPANQESTQGASAEQEHVDSSPV